MTTGKPLPGVNRFIDRLDLACRLKNNENTRDFNGNNILFALEKFVPQPTDEDKIIICDMVIRQMIEHRTAPVLNGNNYDLLMAEMIGSGAHMLRPEIKDVPFERMIDMCTENYARASHFVEGMATSVSLLHGFRDDAQLEAICDITGPIMKDIQIAYAGHGDVSMRAFSEMHRAAIRY